MGRWPRYHRALSEPFPLHPMNEQIDLAELHGQPVLKLQTPDGAVALVSLFVIQLALAFFYQATPEREIAVLTALAWVYLALAVILLVWHARRVPALARAAFGTVPQAE